MCSMADRDVRAVAEFGQAVGRRQKLPVDVFTPFSAPPVDAAEVGRGGRHTCGSFVQNTAAMFGPDGVTAWSALRP